MATHQDWSAHRADERHVERLPQGGAFTLALAYANTYHVGMSSLGFQRVWELVHRRPGWTCERFFADGGGHPVSVEHDSPLGAFGCVAFSVSFEEDYVNLLGMLGRASIPLRRSDRDASHPLIVMGGSCAMINPLPMSEFVDVFALGAAENLLPSLQPLFEEESNRQAVLERLAATPGFYVPAHHRPEDDAELHGVESKLHKLELSEEQMRQVGSLPTSAIVTPRTEFADKFLVEMSRGCPEKCRYCWATFGMGAFRWHPAEYILESLERARRVTDQLGFLATAVGDHPEIERILDEARLLGFRTSVSSVRIPAVTERLLEALHGSGDRSITLAPETGSDELRAKMGKPVTNRMLLEKIRLIFDAGFTQLKLYFIIGQPEETDDDVAAILELGRKAREIMLARARSTGVIGHIHLGVNVLIPKPFTPWQRVPLEDERSLRQKVAFLKRGVASLPNVSLGQMSLRLAKWQSYISRAGADAADALEAAASGEHLASVLRRFSYRIDPEVYGERPGDLPWHFIRAGAPSAPPTRPPAPSPAATAGLAYEGVGVSLP